MSKATAVRQLAPGRLGLLTGRFHVFRSPTASGSNSKAPGQPLVRLQEPSGSLRQSGMAGIVDLGQRVFFPIGYPVSVTPNYTDYVKFSVCQVFTQKISSLLATQAMLLSVGVGKASLPMAAVVNWILKDGIGQLGSVIFGAAVNRNFDCEAKRFRLYAVGLGQIANLFSIITLSYPGLFLFWSALGSACSRISVTATVASRARIQKNFSLWGNLADLMRCNTAQSSGAQLAGTAAGACLAPCIGKEVVNVVGVWIPCGFVSVACCYAAVNTVRMTTFNRQRAEMVFGGIVAHLSSGAQGPLPQPPSVEDIGRLETFVVPYRSRYASTPIVINASLEKVQGVLGTSEKLADAMKKERFACVKGSGGVYLWYAHDVSAEQEIEGFFEALLLCNGVSWRDSAKMRKKYFKRICKDLVSKGWELDSAYLDQNPRMRLEVLDDDKSDGNSDLPVWGPQPGLFMKYVPTGG